MDAVQILEYLIVIYDKANDTKNVERSNDEIDKISGTSDKEIATVKGFLSSFYRKPSSQVSASSNSVAPDLHVEPKQKEREERAPLEYDSPQPKKSEETPMPSSQPSQPLSSSADRKLERIKLPTFNGDKTKFEYFWRAFESIVDNSDEPAKYKMTRLKVCLQGDAQEPISKLDFSEEAYEEAKKYSQTKIWWRKKTTSKLSRGGKED